jgi:thiol-disulfide isomerase/thioredoxin
MRIRCFALLAIFSVLLIGTLIGCSTPASPPSTETAAKDKPVESAAVKAVAQAGGLAAELQGKPVVVDIYASWCPVCKNVAPTLEKLKKEYAGKANFVVLDVSDKAAITKSTARAKELGLDKFLAKNQNQTGLIAVFDPATGKALIEERGEVEIATYKKPLDTLIAKAK